MRDEYIRRAVLHRVIDGDTLDLHIDLGFGMSIRKVRIRLEGIDAPESRTRDLEEKSRGLAAKRFVQDWLDMASTSAESGTEWPLVVQTEKDKRGKYGRWIGDVRRVTDNESLVQALLDAGHAVEANY